MSRILRFLRLLLLLGASLSLALHGSSAAPDAGVASEDIPMRDVLLLSGVSRAGRSAVHTDVVEARIVAGTWHAPTAGESVTDPEGAAHSWTSASATNGALAATPRGGYVDWPVVSPTEGVMILDAAGHNLVYANGELRAGDPYSAGYVQLPVQLHSGTNEFLFQCSRGQLRAKLTVPAGPLLIAPGDRTLPDLAAGENEPVWCAVVLLNTTTNFQQAVVHALTSGSPEREIDIPPLGTHKAPFLLRPPRAQSSNEVRVALEARLRSGSQKDSARADITLRIRRPDQTCKRTFLSTIDDSVQYYAVNPSTAGSGPATNALFLSLHGASVEAIGQADAYSPKTWGPIVCPTNRRPYGFDWEDWGRWDALEVLSLAQARYRPDPTRIYLTGHSMGGHGTWQLGALYPDRFAAIGPSAGWISFTSYVSRNAAPSTNALAQMLRRAAAASDTLLMATNFLQEGVYILHGSDDDNVPVSEARKMRQMLEGFHHDFLYHEQPGVGHWWDASDEPGTDCVDWALMFDFFAHHVIPSDTGLRRVRFVTVNPAVSARSHWATILAQEHSLLPSAVDLQCDPGKRRIVGTTTNVLGLRVDLPALAPGAPVLVDLDGQKLENIPWPKNQDPSSRPGLLLSRRQDRWQLVSSVSPLEKTPGRSGPFREAFNNHLRFIYATRGSAEENAWALRKARYDAESFWYRGNGSVSLVSDVEYLQHLKTRARKSTSSVRQSSRGSENVVVYGNADCNAAWEILLGSSPVQVHRGHASIGDRQFSGDDLACLFLQPNRADDTALIGVVAGAGLPGLRLSERMPYFLSGAGFPDCLLVSAEMLTKGNGGLRAAGFFGPDWSVTNGDFAWQGEAP